MILMMDDGGLAAGMTEKYFSREMQPTGAKIKYIDNLEGKMEEKVEKFPHGAAVPPCLSCEVVLPLLICPGDKVTCSH